MVCRQLDTCMWEVIRSWFTPFYIHTQKGYIYIIVEVNTVHISLAIDHTYILCSGIFYTFAPLPFSLYIYMYIYILLSLHSITLHITPITLLSPPSDFPQPHTLSFISFLPFLQEQHYEPMLATETRGQTYLLPTGRQAEVLSWAREVCQCVHWWRSIRHWRRGRIQARRLQQILVVRASYGINESLWYLAWISPIEILHKHQRGSTVTYNILCETEYCFQNCNHVSDQSV